MKASRCLIAALLVCGLVLLVAVPTVKHHSALNSGEIDLQSSTEFEWPWARKWIDMAKDLLNKMYAPVQALIDAIKKKVQSVIDTLTSVNSGMESAVSATQTAHKVVKGADDTVGSVLESASNVLGIVADIQVNIQTHINGLQTSAHVACGLAAAGTADLQWFEAVVDLWNTLSKAVQDAVSSLVNQIRDFMLSGVRSMKDTCDAARQELFEARVTMKVAMEKAEWAQSVTQVLKDAGDAISQWMGTAKPEEITEKAMAAMMADLQLGNGEEWFWPAAADKAREVVNKVLTPVREAFEAAQAKIDEAATSTDELHIAVGYVQKNIQRGAALVTSVQSSTAGSIKTLKEWLDDRLPKEMQKINALLQRHITTHLAHPDFCKNAAANAPPAVASAMASAEVDLEWFENVSERVKEVSGKIMSPIRTKIASMRDFLGELEGQIESAKSGLNLGDKAVGVVKTSIGVLQSGFGLIRSDASKADSDLKDVPRPTFEL
jgi:hypothetical protein